MGLFGGGNSKRTTINEDNRTIFDQSGSTFDNRTDNSVDDNSYSDSSSYLEIDKSDNSYTDNSIYQDIDNSDNSYKDESITGEYAGNSGAITITDGGAFDVATVALHELGSGVQYTADAIAEVSTNAIDGNVYLASQALDGSYEVVSAMDAVTQAAMEQVSQNSSSTLAAALEANQNALSANAKLINTSNLKGQNLISEASVSMTKWFGGGVLVFGLGAYALSKRK